MMTHIYGEGGLWFCDAVVNMCDNGGGGSKILKNYVTSIISSWGKWSFTFTDCVNCNHLYYWLRRFRKKFDFPVIIKVFSNQIVIPRIASMIYTRQSSIDLTSQFARICSKDLQNWNSIRPTTFALQNRQDLNRGSPLSLSLSIFNHIMYQTYLIT